MVTGLLRPANARIAGRYVNKLSRFHRGLCSIKTNETNTCNNRWNSNHTTNSPIFGGFRINESPLMENHKLGYLNNFLQTRFNTTTAPMPEETVERTIVRGPNFAQLERVFAQFEDKCQRNESLTERDFVKTFDFLTRFLDTHDMSSYPEELYNIAMYASMLLKCCGNLMVDVPQKGRELLAGNLWTYIKEKKIPLDISHYNSLLRVLNENETVFDPKKLKEEIEAANLTADRITYQRLIHQYCLQGDIAGATGLLEEMKNSDLELNEQIFASLIIGYGKQETAPSMTEMFELMKSNNIEPGSKSYTAALISLAKRMEKDPKLAEEFNKVVELMDKDEIQPSVYETVDLITHVGPLRKSNEVAARLLDDFVADLRGPVATKYRILISLLRINQFDEASKLFWSQRFSEKALETGYLGTYWIKAMVKHFNVPLEFIDKECEELRTKRINTKAFHQSYYTAAECGRLDVVRGALKKLFEDEPMKVHYYWPLIAQAKDEADLTNTLKNDLNPMMPTNDLMDTFIQWIWPKFGDNPERLFELNKELKYDNGLLIASFLNYSVQEDKIMQAIEFISKAPEQLVQDTTESKQDNLDDDRHDSRSARGEQVNRNDMFQRLLNNIAEQTQDPELVKKAFNMCQLPGRMPSPRTLGSLIKVHLLKKDYEGALKEFLRIAQEYRMTPCRTELIQHCLVEKNPEDLQKIMNVVTEIYGESNALYDLAVCCLRCNKLKQAQKIFASPGFRVNPVRVYGTCRNLAQQGQVDALENLVSLVREMYDINQETLYQILLNTYDRTSNAKRALRLWNMMQEEEFQPSKRSLLMIAEILEKNSIEVPFQKPKITSNDDRAQRRSQ